MGIAAIKVLVDIILDLKIQYKLCLKCIMRCIYKMNRPKEGCKEVRAVALKIFLKKKKKNPM